MPRFVLILFLLAGLSSSASAVQIVTGTITYQTTEPTDSQVPGWTSGWGSSGITGWDYVGDIPTKGGSGVYLGNDWVITAGHVGAGDFVLNGVTYTVVAGSATSITDSTGLADITLFQISTAPSLPALTITGSTPTVGQHVVMIGYGGGAGETWGDNKISLTDYTVTISPHKSTDFVTGFGDFSGYNKARLTGGDSGGGDFTFNTTSHQWELAGINEAIDADSNSYFVQLSTYSSQINTIVAVPEPHAWTYLVVGILFLGIYRKVKARSYRG